MKKYESPRIKFKNLELFEKISDTCWGTKGAWVKNLEDPTPLDPDNPVISDVYIDFGESKNGCSGAQDLLEKALKDCGFDIADWKEVFGNGYNNIKSTDRKDIFVPDTSV